MFLYILLPILLFISLFIAMSNINELRIDGFDWITLLNVACNITLFILTAIRLYILYATGI